MPSVYFDDGTSIEIEDVRGDNPRFFTVPENNYTVMLERHTKQETIRFGPHGEEYLLKRMTNNRCEAVRRTSRR